MLPADWCLEREVTPEARDIVERLAPEWQALFLAKNANYGEHADDLGVRGQYADIHRKTTLLRRALWDGEELRFESAREVCFDLIGHLFLTIAKLDKK